MDEVSSSERLIDCILEYINDDSHRYAIAIEGPWGTGKTRFIENDLRDALKEKTRTRDKKKHLIRVSLFGISTAEELFGVVVSAAAHLGDTDSSKAKTVAKSFVGNIPEAVRTLASMKGVSLNLTASTKAIATLFLNENHVLVIDDVERRSKNADDMSLFGAVNDLVEDMGIKTIFITNSLSSGATDSTENRSLDKDIKEKLIWKVFTFAPTPIELVNSIYDSLTFPNTELDVMECIRNAAQSCNCCNARAMIRSKSFVEKLSSIPALLDNGLALTSRKAAFVDGIKMALLVCMGNAPEEPICETSFDGFSPEFIEYQEKKELFDQYSDFRCIHTYFDSKSVLLEGDLEKGFRRHIEIRYPDSDDTVELRGICTRLKNFYCMTDDEVLDLLPRFSEIITNASFSADLIRDAISWNKQLTDLGFQNLPENKEVLSRCKIVIDRDLLRAYDLLGRRVLTFPSDDEETKHACLELHTYINEAWTKFIAASVEEIDIGNANCGLELAKKINEIWDRNNEAILSFPAKAISDIFFVSNPAGQEAIRAFFVRLREYCIAFYDGDRYERWLSDIKSLLEKQTPNDRTSEMRKRWFLGNIDDLLSFRRQNMVSNNVEDE